MALFTFAEARAAYKAELQRHPGFSFKTAKQVLLSESTTSAQQVHFDVFLSHNHLDEEIVLGMYYLLSSQYRLTVYVDAKDEELADGAVTPTTADVLRKRMRSSKSLVYVASHNSGESRWMPWELGYFDAFRGTVAIAPVDQQASTSFEGQEYLGLYPYVDHDLSGNLRVNRAPGTMGPILFKEWLAKAR